MGRRSRWTRRRHFKTELSRIRKPGPRASLANTSKHTCEDQPIRSTQVSCSSLLPERPWIIRTDSETGYHLCLPREAFDWGEGKSIRAYSLSQEAGVQRWRDDKILLIAGAGLVPS